jgi:formate dehydrogenase major subunit
MSPYGQIRLRALVTDRVKGNELFLPMNSSESAVNRLTSNRRDPITDTPAYKEASVRLEVLSDQGENPLPKTNSRFGHRTPQKGVEVERKWKRPDYREPGSELVQIKINGHER